MLMATDAGRGRACFQGLRSPARRIPRRMRAKRPWWYRLLTTPLNGSCAFTRPSNSSPIPFSPPTLPAPTPPSVAVEIASHIDTITLDSLARTCRAAHAGLIQYRRALLASTLRCHQDPLPVDPKDTFRFRARASEWYLQSRPSPRLQNYNGKAGTCARDMVSECRRCLKVVCRVSVSV